MESDPGLPMRLLIEAALSDARRLAPRVKLSAECSEGRLGRADVLRLHAVARALVRIALVLRPGAARLFARAHPEEGAIALELVADDVAREAPASTAERRRVERSVAEIEDAGGSFDRRSVNGRRRYVLRAALAPARGADAVVFVGPERAEEARTS
jgi:hypothetical protein